MLEQHARVVHSSGEDVWVKATEPSACGVCAGQGCTSRRIAELFQRLPRQYQVESRFPVSPGDNVIVGMPEGSVLRSALYLYGMPLLLMMGGALLAQLGWAGDGGAVAGAVLGLLMAGALITVRPHSTLTSVRPVIIRRSQASDESILEEEK